MAFDGFFTRKIINELSQNLIQARINKINNISNDEFIFSIRKGKNLKLFLSANSTSSRIHFTNIQYENPLSPSNFCTVLRKYLTNGIISDIIQVSNDRIIKIKIKNFDELGYEKHYILIVELMGKHSNIILTSEDGIIIESLNNSYNLEYKRSTVANIKYTLPPTDKKLNPFDFENYTKLNPKNENKKFLIQNFYGVSSLLNNYILQKYPDDVLNGLKILCKSFNTDFRPSIINNKKDFYYFDITDTNETSFKTLSELLDFYYMDLVKKSINKNTDKKLFDFIKNKLNRLNNKLKILQNELDISKNKDDFKLKGQLLIANIYLFKNNVPEIVTVQNFYSENLENINIKLDTTLSIEQNAEKYFNLYKKNIRTIENLEKQIALTNEEITYFDTIKFQTENADKTELVEIKEELISGGYLREKQIQKKKNKQKYFTVENNGITIYIGKNNIQNDTITNKLAHRNYLWFHAKDIPGSHVVIFSSNPDEETINIAANLAGYYSKFKNEINIDVDMTLIKNVKKISGSKPGFVRYTGQKTLKIKIDKLLINKLINSK
ncbi:Rqc2 family fibronectin-binding protein [Gemella bergeri]